MLEFSESAALRNAVEDATSGLLDQAIHVLIHEHSDDVHAVLDVVQDEPIDDTHAIDLSLDEKLTAIENHADDFGLELGDVALDNLRFRIEGLACFVIHSLALQEVTETLEDFEEFVEEHDLELDRVSEHNDFGWAVHRAERSEGAYCTVYEYRNVDECNVDVWHYFRGRWNVYLTQWIDAEEE